MADNHNKRAAASVRPECLEYQTAAQMRGWSRFILADTWRRIHSTVAFLIAG